MLIRSPSSSSRLVLLSVMVLMLAMLAACGVRQTGDVQQEPPGYVAADGRARQAANARPYRSNAPPLPSARRQPLCQSTRQHSR